MTTLIRTIRLHPVMMLSQTGGTWMGFSADDFIRHYDFNLAEIVSRYGLIVYDLYALDIDATGGVKNLGIPCLVEKNGNYEVDLVFVRPEQNPSCSGLLIDYRFIVSCLALIEHGCRIVEAIKSNDEDGRGQCMVNINGTYYRLIGRGIDNNIIEIAPLLSW